MQTRLDNKLTVLQDKAGNAGSTLNTFAEKSIYFDGKSNDSNEAFTIGTTRTKSKDGTIGLDFSSDANIDSIASGGTIEITQKAKNLFINKISMYGNDGNADYDTSEDILYPHDRISGNSEAGNGRIVLKALDAYNNDSSGSNITVNEAYILGLGLGISDVELQADRIIFSAIAKSNLSNEQIVFDVQGVTPDEVDAVNGSARNNYKQSGGHYIAENVFVGVGTDSANNNGLTFDTLYANDAKIITNNTNLKVEEGFIGDYATFINGNIDATGYNHNAVVNNREKKELVDTQYQMYTKKTGDFNLGMDETIVLKTNAPVVYYDPNMLVNGYHSENSFTRATLKENIVQQTTRDLYKNVSVQDIDAIKTQYVKLDTSNIISDEIKIYSLSQESDLSEDYVNISLEKEEKIGG